MLVMENELQKQIQMDPMFLISSYEGDEEAVYSKMISGERISSVQTTELNL